ncbi:MAG: NUDIX hydrolase [bacterium]
MKEELLDIYTQDRIALNKVATKYEVHQKGYYHHTAHLWLFNKRGEILLAQRAASKIICPLLWDVSVAGHVDAGETIVDATIREAYEEIGLKLQTEQLINIGVYDCFKTYSNGVIDNEFHNTFIALSNLEINDYSIDKTEVEAIKYVNSNGFINLLNSPDNFHFIKENKSYYEFVLSEIQKAIQNL